MKLTARCGICPGYIEYQSDQSGSAVTCPHCLQETTLPEKPFTPQPLPAKGFPWMLAISIFGIVLLISGFILSLTAVGDRSPGNMLRAALAAILMVGGSGILSLQIYFIPGIVASKRSHRNELAIWLLNFFLGWTLLGWVAALVWSVHRDK